MKNVFKIVSQFFTGSSSNLVSPTLSIINPSIAVPIASSSALIASIAISIKNKCISKLKIRFTKLRLDSVISLLYEKTLKQSMLDKELDEIEGIDFKKI